MYAIRSYYDEDLVRSALGGDEGAFRDLLAGAPALIPVQLSAAGGDVEITGLLGDGTTWSYNFV